MHRLRHPAAHNHASRRDRADRRRRSDHDPISGARAGGPGAAVVRRHGFHAVERRRSPTGRTVRPRRRGDRPQRVRRRGGAVADDRVVARHRGRRNGGPSRSSAPSTGRCGASRRRANNSMGVGYCVMEDVAGEGTVALQPDPAAWDAGEMARAAALMATFGGDRVVPYGIDASGAYDVAIGRVAAARAVRWRRVHPTTTGGRRLRCEDVRRRREPVGRHRRTQARP